MIISVYIYETHDGCASTEGGAVHMNKKPVKTVKAFVGFLLSVFIVLSGCTVSRTSTMINGITIRISMYNDISYSGWRTYVESKFPDVNFIWENNRNSTQNLIYQAEHGDMADIVMIRRFENDNASALAPYLEDLSGSSLASTFTDGSLIPYTYAGKVCWLPAPGMMESIYVNQTLFEQYGIKIPETLSEFEDACEKFNVLGIKGFAVNLSAGYRSTFVLEGLGNVYFSSAEGEQWLDSFHNNSTSVLSENGAVYLAEMLRTFRNKGVLSESDLTLQEVSMFSEFDTNEAAMITAPSDVAYTGKRNTKYTILPCLGDTKEDQTLYTYPVFNTAVSKKVADDSEKQDIVHQILNVMYSEDAQKILAEGTDALFSYNKDIDLPINSLYQPVADLIHDKKCIVRFLNRNMFSASVAAVSSIIKDNADNTEFMTVINHYLSAPQDTTVIGTSSLHAGNQLGEDYPLERSSASVIAQTVKMQIDADAVIIEAKDAAAPIYKGDYTASDLNAAVVDEKLYSAELSEAQMQNVFDAVMTATTTYGYNSQEPMVDYPALSGIKADLSIDGTENTLINLNGTALDQDRTYHVVISQIIMNALTSLRDENAVSFTGIDDTLLSCFTARLQTGRLPEAEQYFKVEAVQ